MSGPTVSCVSLLPAQLDRIGVARARLPEVYEHAKAALARCVSVDECKDWSDKAQALASYARQAGDQELFNHARRVQARASRRCGELLKQFDGRGGSRSKNDGGVTFAPAKTGGVQLSSASRGEAARRAGLSSRQQTTAMRIANVPENDFEQAVDSDNPPSVTGLAQQGRKQRPKPAGFTEATHLIGSVGRFAEFCAGHDPAFVAGGITPSEVEDVLSRVETIEQWLARLVCALRT